MRGELLEFQTMRRYQGLSPDNLPLSNGRKSHWRTCKEDDGMGSREIDDDTKIIPTFVEGNKGLPRFRSPSSKTQDQNFSPYTGNDSVSDSPPLSKNNHQHDTTSPIRNGGDVLLQWGHRKRSRCSRTIESRATGVTVTTDESSSSSTQIQAMIKVQRRSITQPPPATTTAPAGVVELVDKHKLMLSTNNKYTNIMPPPPSMLPTTISTTAAAANTSTSNGKGGNIKPCSRDTSSFLSNRRNLEERSGGGSGSQPPRNSGGGSSGRVGAATAAASSSRSKVGKRYPPKVIEKHDHRKSISYSSGSASLRDDKLNNGCASLIEETAIGMNNHSGSAPSQSGVQEAGCSTTTTPNHDDDNNTMKSATMAAGGGGGEKVNGGGGGEVNEWPRVYIPLTRKEKEEDFLAMKGTKLPHRPKKRPKAVDRMLQYCFPGMWLSDVTRARYEVKEKKCAKKPKRRGGLKGMESMGSDSE